MGDYNGDSGKVTPKPTKLKRTKADFYFKCAFCDSECEDDAVLKIHIDSKHLDVLFKFPCDLCEFNAQGPKSLRQHKSEEHSAVVKNENIKIEQKTEIEESESSLSGTDVKVIKLKIKSDS